MSLKIREAAAGEIQTLLDFEQAIICVERPFDNSLQEGKIRYYDLIELMQSKKALVLVAEVAGEIVGSGYAKIMKAKKHQKFSAYAYLGFMYVKPNFRGQSINNKIIQILIDWAKTKKMSEIRLEVYDQNYSAKNAYLKAGFKPNLVEMRLEI